MAIIIIIIDDLLLLLCFLLLLESSMDVTETRCLMLVCGTGVGSRRYARDLTPQLFMWGY